MPTFQFKNHKNYNNMCPTYREVRLIQLNLSNLSDKFNMELDTHPDKLTKCVRLIEKSNLLVVRLTEI